VLVRYINEDILSVNLGGQVFVNNLECLIGFGAK